jgi:hypothetical protein
MSSGPGWGDAEIVAPLDCEPRRPAPNRRRNTMADDDSQDTRTDAEREEDLRLSRLFADAAKKILDDE